MRITISLLLLLAVFLLNAQRLRFQDPALKLSFKKPSSWEVFDNGYIIKVAPSAKDTLSVYLTITYFTPPVPIEGLSEEDLATLIPESSVATQFEYFPLSTKSVRLFREEIKWRSSKDQISEYRFYSKSHLGENWEIVATAPAKNYDQYRPTFERIINSIKARRNSK